MRQSERHQDTDSSSSLDPIQKLFSDIQRHLHKIRGQKASTHFKLIRKEYPAVREDMVKPTELATAMLHKLQKQGVISSVVYVPKNSSLDRQKADLIAVRPDRTAVVIQATGGTKNASEHRNKMRRHFATDDLSILPITVVRVRSQRGNYYTAEELTAYYEKQIRECPGISLKQK